MASDSRLTGGQCFDQGPKVFPLPRSDAILGFGGDTYYAYPLVTHLQTSIGAYPRSSDRRFPLGHAIRHASRVFAQSYGLIHDFPAGADRPIDGDAQFLFGGYSWHSSRFRIWQMRLDRQQKAFPVRAVSSRFYFIGSPLVVKEALEQTNRLLASRSRTQATMDMEPFEVLRDIVKGGRHRDVGGAPQVAKVFRHMNTQFYATVWPCDDGSVMPHVYGRPLQNYESISWPAFDPTTLDFCAVTPGAASQNPSRVSASADPGISAEEPA